MEKTRHYHESIEEREFKLLVRKDNVTGGLNVAASSSGAWASSVSLSVSAEGVPCCTAVISPGPDMQQIVAEVLQPDERDAEPKAAESIGAEQTDDEEPAAISAAADEHEGHDGKASNQGSKPEGQLEGRPFEEIAKGAAKKASDAKPSGSKQASKPISGGRQTARTITGSSQTAARR